jgi:NRAMP (natural resistance-associated macrophage protein)-like metal ion transporter
VSLDIDRPTPPPLPPGAARRTLPARFSRLLHVLGPGLITGAADDDPSGIATYTQTGAQFGYGQLWTALFMLPFQTAVQEACARIGTVTGHGIATMVGRRYKRRVLYGVVALVLAANTINIGADIGAVAASAHLIVPVSPLLLAPLFAAGIVALEVMSSYRVYARVLKWLSLSLVAYVLTALLVEEPWQTLLHATVVPNVSFTFSFFYIITGVLGTTISPYMFFWEASEEVEEAKLHHLIDGRGVVRLTRAYLRDLRLDNILGMLASEVATWAVIVVGATVLHANGVTNVGTAADAAKALEPLVQTFPHAGFLAKLIFASGVIGLGLLAIPVLSGSASYALCEAVNWTEGLDLTLQQAHGFYGVIIVATGIGVVLNFLGIDPMRALVFTAVFNGVAAVPLLFVIARIAEDGAVMGAYRSGRLSRTLVWATVFAMGAAALTMFATLGRG